MPQGAHFPDWRSGDVRALQDLLDAPRWRVLFSVEHNAFWLDEWGPRPRALHDALDLVAERIGAAPRLIPIFAHRMMPDEPHASGNPVFSVHQTDILRYGFDLADYLRLEFGLGCRQPWPSEARPVRFWDTISDHP